MGDGLANTFIGSKSQGFSNTRGLRETSFGYLLEIALSKYLLLYLSVCVFMCVHVCAQGTRTEFFFCFFLLFFFFNICFADLFGEHRYIFIE